MTTPPAERATRRLLSAVHAREAAAAGACFRADGTWANVPHPPSVGPDGVRALLTPILERSSRVRWDLVSAAYSNERAWLERVDRFWIDGEEYAVECNGVLEVDPDTGLITALRDYVDLATWRARLGDALGGGVVPPSAS
ncbi:MAG: nuclear transport factor 2 family protein [Sporichthyaceae bacterium]